MKKISELIQTSNAAKHSLKMKSYHSLDDESRLNFSLILREKFLEY
jgi:hypothetical protein